MLCHK
ncbi:hypothetical protein ECFDA506_2046, partial [Escherichia coli FDA506]